MADLDALTKLEQHEDREDRDELIASVIDLTAAYYTALRASPIPESMHERLLLAFHRWYLSTLIDVGDDV